MYQVVLGRDQARVGGKECTEGKPETINRREKGSSAHKKVGGIELCMRGMDCEYSLQGLDCDI